MDRHDFVYPGHPITIAYFIVEKYGTLTEALKKGLSSPAALEDNDIPGAGGPVYSALEFLIKAKTDFNEAVNRARVVWTGEAAGCYKNRLESGQTQADSITEELREKLVSSSFFA